jgi:DNA-binding HxlR family transcriptional regulator
MATSDYRGPPAVKSRIWTSQPKAGAQHWRCEDIRAVLPHRSWRRDLRRAVDTADHPQPVPWLRKLLEGAPGLSRTLLSQRLKQLERLGVVGSAPKPDGRGHHYELTSSGHDLFKVCVSLGEWGARWLEIAPENLDPFVALWSMCNALRRDRLPDRRVVIRFDFTGRAHRERYWLLIELGDTEICKTCPGVDEDLYITADAEAFVKWHAGQLTWAQATREGRIQVDGLPSLVRAFPTWNARSMFAHIRPVSRTATSKAD